MIKHSEIIEKLSEEQKLRLVTDFAALGDDALNELGVPRVCSTDLDEINAGGGGMYPSFFGLANCWNKTLIAKVAADLAYSVGGNANLIETPPARTKSSVYVDGVSEDPFLTHVYAESICSGIEDAGAAACLTDCSVREADVAALDKKPDMSVFSDFLISPYLHIAKRGGVTAVKCSRNALRRSHGAIAEGVENMLRKAVNKSTSIMFSGASQDTLVATMPVANEIVCNTPLSLLRAALVNYRRLKTEVEHGTVSVGELNKAFADGVAVSEEMLDAAVDKVIEFAKKCSKKRALPWHSETTDYESELSALNRKLAGEQEKQFGDPKKFKTVTSILAVQESIVMLKNLNVLPVRGGKIAILGELGKTISGLESTFIRYCTETRGEFLGYSAGYAEEEEKSPELLSQAVKLAKTADTIVMFMGLGKREKAAEVSSLMLPANQLALLDAVSDLEKNVIVVIRGDLLPDMEFDDYCSGVLFCPLGGTYAAEALCGVIFGKYNPSGRLAVSGYEDADGYHKTLRDYKVSGKNKVGQFVGYRHYTSNGTKAKYPFGFGLSYSKFDYSGAKLEKDGVALTVRNSSKVAGYEVVQLYVGKRNSALIRPKRELKGFVKVYLKAKEKRRVVIPLDVDDLAVYDPNDGMTKVEDGKYTLYIGASCTDIRLSLDYTANGEKIAKTGDKLSDYLQGVSNITDGGYKLPGGKGKGKGKTAAEVVPDFPYEKLFMDEFGLDVELEEEYYEQEVAVSRDDEDKTTRYIGDGIKPGELCDKLIDYFTDCGMPLTAPNARELISAMAASRILFVCTDDQLLFNEYVTALGGFFGGSAAFQSVDGITSTEELLSDGSPTAEMLEASSLTPEAVCIVALDNVSPAALGSFFTPFIRYAANPENNRITFGSYATGERTLTVAPNIWFAMRVPEDCACEIPSHLADIATFIMLDLELTERQIGITEPTGVNYYKFAKAFERVEEKFELDEKDWKRIDKLVGYVNSRSKAEIGNKMWLQMERLSAAYFALGGEGDSALDVVVCGKLIPLFAPLIRGKLTRDDGDFSQILDNIFGDESVPNSKSVSTRLGLIATE
ncbi:MAG: glycoside hydrolase family 3 C-terminal domain-containing protein [Clostridiales bacterium]|nr:glycoside hydrolase family 3 C-terminal domain-containing protein [Clostridiales bacterium]